MTYQNKAFKTFTWGILTSMATGLLYFFGNVILKEIPDLRAEVKQISQREKSNKEFLIIIHNDVKEIRSHLLDKK